jgi:hypothetical protein
MAGTGYEDVVSHDSTLARVTATAEYNKCLNEAGTAGYKKVQ